jgi:hypothetical protein
MLMIKSRSLVLAVAVASAALISLAAEAVDVCDKSCLGPLCMKNCVPEPGVTIGRGKRDQATIQVRNRRTGPVVVIEEGRRPSVDIDVGR